MLKIPFFKFFTKTKFSVSDKNNFKNKVGWAFSPTMKLCWGRNPNLQKAISYASRTATRDVKGDLAPAFTLAEVFSPYYHSPRRVAFTLAEVLITLGIIGVVAAMTLPTLIANHQQKVTVTKLKKVYSILNQAYLRAQNDNGTIDNWGLSNSQFEENPDTGEKEVGDQALNISMLFWSKLQPYLQVLKTCTDTTSDAQCETRTTYSLDGRKRYDSSVFRLILNDGAALAGGWLTLSDCNTDKRKSCGDIFVDINGTAAPNTYGRDIFYFWVFKDRILPMGYAEDRYKFEDLCSRTNNGQDANGYACTAWVIFNENMDYLKCDGLSWSGKHKCK